MRFRFTKHVSEKLILLKRFRFKITKKQIKETINNPLKVEDKDTDLHIATSLLDENHVLRVVYRFESDIIVIITCYPGRRKAYEI